MLAGKLRLPIGEADLKQLFRRYGVVEASVFGSYARGDFTPASDLDLLVDLEPGRSYLDLGGLQYELARKSGKKVDVLLKNSVRRRMKPYIYRDKVDLEV
jgi:predicted nucleotidyltransferase